MKARTEVGEVESRGEVVAVSEHDGGAQALVAVELPVGEAQLLQHREVRRVALLRPVEPDDQDVPVAVDGDSLTHVTSVGARIR